MKCPIIAPGLLLSLSIVSCTNSGLTEKGNTPVHPNVLLIITDDQGWGDIRSHGNDTIDTPNLDRLASESYRMNRFYVSPVCAPTRASLLTGRYHLRTGVNGVTNRLEVMRDSELTLAEIFRNNKYLTSCFGKWHNGAQFPNNPAGQGFDRFFGFCAGHWNGYHDPVLEYQGEMVKTRGYITDILTDSAISYISENKNKSFFTYVAYNTPHTPYQVPDSYFRKYKAKGLDDPLACTLAMCENIDDNVGRILKALDDLQLRENTIVIFLSDNGPDSWRFNGGMKGKKAWVDEGGVRVPCFIRIPWKNKTEVNINSIAAHIDILPTLSELCGLELPQGLNTDGINLIPFLDNPELIDEDRYIFTDRGLNSKTPYALRSYRYLLTTGKDTLLFDLVSDPGQKNDISALMPELKTSLLKKYDRWYNEVSSFGFEMIPIVVGYKNVDVVRMPAHEAVLSKNLEYFEGHGWAHDWVTGFRNTRDTVSWKVSVVTEGTYTIELALDSPATNKGRYISLEFDDLSVKSKITEEYKSYVRDTMDKVARKEVRAKIWPVMRIENVKLPEGNYMLSLCLEQNLKAGVDIKGIEIYPAQ